MYTRECIRVSIHEAPCGAPHPCSLGREILPAFKEREQVARANLAMRLSSAIDLTMKRKKRTAPGLPEGFTVASPGAALIKARGGNERIEKMASDTATGARRH